MSTKKFALHVETIRKDRMQIYGPFESFEQAQRAAKLNFGTTVDALDDVFSDCGLLLTITELISLPC